MIRKTKERSYLFPIITIVNIIKRQLNRLWVHSMQILPPTLLNIIHKPQKVNLSESATLFLVLVRLCLLLKKHTNGFLSNSISLTICLQPCWWHSKKILKVQLTILLTTNFFSKSVTILETNILVLLLTPQFKDSDLQSITNSSWTVI